MANYGNEPIGFEGAAYGDTGAYGDYDDSYWEDYNTPKEREFGHVDVLVWMIFPFAATGFVTSLITLVFVALFPKPLKTTVIHCIVLCVSSILICVISLVQASTWETKTSLKAKLADEEFIIVDYAVSWITILIIGVSNWLFVGFACVRLKAIVKLNINRYEDYVTASSDDVSATPRSRACDVCRVVFVILFFGWILPTLVLPLLALIDYKFNWLPEESDQLSDVLAFAFAHGFNNRWGSVIYVLLPCGVVAVLSIFIVSLTFIKIRGLKLMERKWDKSKITLWQILVFFLARAPMLAYIVYVFKAYPAEPQLTGDPQIDAKLQEDFNTAKYIDSQKIKSDILGPIGPICLILLCLAATLNLPIFALSSHRFKTLCGKAKNQCHDCRRGRSDDEDDVEDSVLSQPPQTTPSTTTSYILTPHKFHNGTNGNFFFNPAHLNNNVNDFNHINANGYVANGNIPNGHSTPIKEPKAAMYPDICSSLSAEPVQTNQ